ncbi:hypothetical protein [Streptomyces sp. S186]|uniref:hypothetical protein n=1 Tax=Streptomyces sp. S186 TaxID=3434395 RepID=UPI003F679050
MTVQKASGSVTFLRVNDSEGWGPPNDHIDVDVIVRLDSEPNRAFGFPLRGDPTGEPGGPGNLPARQAMFWLLTLARADGIRVNIDYDDQPPKTNSIMFRVEMLP